jgi:hypothetical protein
MAVDSALKKINNRLPSNKICGLEEQYLQTLKGRNVTFSN